MSRAGRRLPRRQHAQRPESRAACHERLFARAGGTPSRIHARTSSNDFAYIMRSPSNPGTVAPARPGFAAPRTPPPRDR